MVGPTLATAESQIAELQKTIEGLQLTPSDVADDKLAELQKTIEGLQLTPSDVADDKLAELQKTIEGLQLRPPPASIGDILDIVVKRLQDLEIGPSLSGLVSDIAKLQSQIQNASVAPDDSVLVSEIANLKTAVQALEQNPPVAPFVETNNGTVTSVNVSGGSTGLTFAGGPITTSGTITMAGTLATANGGTGSTSTTFVNLATNVTGTLAVANGGTGASSLTGAGIVTTTNSQTISGQKSFTSYTNTFRGLTYSTSDGGVGSNAYFGENSATAVIGGVNGVVLASGGTYPGTTRYSADAVSFRPAASSLYSLGTSSQQWTSVYANELVAGASGAAQYQENSGFAVVNGTSGVVTAFNGTTITVTQSTGFRPGSDNIYTLGTSGQRWSEVYAAVGTINTSDGTQKQQVRDLTDAERNVAKTIKGLIRAYKFNDAVEAKGDEARIHIGVIAQDVQAAFAAEGLDATKYGLFCSDTYDTLDGKTETRLGVRYGELLAFVIGSL
jgi:hypothetical protein